MYTEETETAFGDQMLAKKIDEIFKLSMEAMLIVKDVGEYTDDENEVLDELVNFINAYKNAFV